MPKPIEAVVYDGTAPSVQIDALADSAKRKWLHELNDSGSGSLMVHTKDAVLTLNPGILDYGNIIRFSLNGTERFASIIEAKRIPPAGEGEESDAWWEVSGRGVLALLEDAIVYPEASVEGSLQRQRAFDWTAIVYDDAAWIAATQVQRQDATGGTVPDYNGFPLDWPDPLAYWIWSRAQSSPTWTPAGTSYFRKTFTMAAAGEVFIFATADNNFRLWLDGELVFDVAERGFRWGETFKEQRFLSAGDHQLAAEVINYDSASGGASPAALLVSVTQNAMGSPGTVIVRSDSSWVCLDYPSEVPGMSVGEILRILIEEAQDRGALPGITISTFTDETDSSASLWSSEPDIALDIGTNYLDVIRTFVEQFVDVAMTPDLEFKVYNKGTLGSDLTGSVALVVGTHFEREETEGQDLDTNAVLARDTLGALTTREDATSIATRKRKETYLELALAPNATRAREMCDEIFVDHASPAVQMTSRVTAASGPYTTWTVGDTIITPGPDGTPTDTTVLSIGVEEDDAGHPVYHAEGAQFAST